LIWLGSKALFAQPFGLFSLYNKTLISTILLLAVCLSAQDFEGKVVAVTDADTISVTHSDGNIDRVRLIGLDAPEVAKSSKEISQPFGEKCKKILEDLILGKTVMVLTSKRDSYGRNLGRVIFGEIDTNLVMLTQGCAWIFYPSVIPTPELRAKYIAAFEYAQANKIGLFSQKRVQKPANWRKRRHYRKRK
jgi:endonuclease YncB( thermonuclease family)